MGPIQATLFGKGGFQGHGAGPATKCSTWNTGISGAMGHCPIGDGAFGTWGRGGPDDPSGRGGRWFTRPGQPAVEAVDSPDGDVRVTPYEARSFRRRQVCHTRVQELAFGGQLSNTVQSNVKSGEIGPYWTYSAITWVPGQLPPPLDSARNEIGQLSSGIWAWCWTAPATKSDSLSRRWDRVGRDGWPVLGGGSRRVRAGGGDADLGAGDSRTVVLSDVSVPAGRAIRRKFLAAGVRPGITAAGTSWQSGSATS